jgi:PAS domain S-box-containing protein
MTDHPARVLIVDDDRHNRQVLEVMLSTDLVHVWTAASGKDALAMVAQAPPDLILLDVMMPGMDGYQVTAALKGNPATQHIPIIMVTALDDRGARVRALDAGAEEFLTKPVDRAEVRVRVRNLLRLKAYADHFDSYSRVLEAEAVTSVAALADRAKLLKGQAAALAEQAALLDLAHDAIVVRDMTGQITFWSRGAEFMYGWRSQEAVGKQAFDLLRTELPERAEAVDATFLREGRWEGEAVQHKRDGTRAVVDSRWSLQRDAAGVAIRVLSIDNDITERKRADVEIRALTERDQMRQAQMRFKDEFLSNVSHELRSPLTAIKQFTSILLGGIAGDLNNAQREYQQIVLKNINQLQAMIGDLLEVTQLETGKFSLALEAVSLTDAVNDAFATLQVTARTKGVTLSGDVPPDLPPVHADQTRLRQILTILVDNAVKFTPQGGAVTIRGRWLAEDPRFLRVDVRDTGCGIGEEARERIFERLYQVAEPAQAGRKGLGLGLYICKELVTRQGGGIWVTSQPGRGSTFSFTLPVFLDSVAAGVPSGHVVADAHSVV